MMREMEALEMTQQTDVTQTGTPIRLAAVDDHAIVVRGVEALAEQHPDRLTLVVQARTAQDLIAAVADQRIDVALLDLYLNDGSEAPDTIRSLTGLGIQCLMYTSEVRPMPIRNAIRAGAAGVALKSDPDETLLEAIQQVASGEFAVSSDLAYVLATDETLAAHLAPRELQALQLYAAGVPKKAIGRRMNPPVEESTVITYFSRIAKRYADLDRAVGNAFGAVREAHRDGYLDLPQ